MIRILRASLFTGIVAIAAPAFASTIAEVETGTLTNPVTIGDTSTPIITTILSYPVGSLDGYNYTRYVEFAQDSTGSLDIFGAPTGSTYVPQPGDAISATGSYSQFDAIPEIGSPWTSLSAASTGNPVPAATVANIPALNAITSTSFNYLGYYLELDNVSITGTTDTSWPVHANLNYDLTDGTNTIDAFFWASSYSLDGALGGAAIPTGPLDVKGFVDLSAGFPPEFVALSFTSVPEPASFGLIAAGAALLLRRKARKA